MNSICPPDRVEGSAVRRVATQYAERSYSSHIEGYFAIGVCLAGPLAQGKCFLLTSTFIEPALVRPSEEGPSPSLEPSFPGQIGQEHPALHPVGGLNVCDVGLRRFVLPARRLFQLQCYHVDHRIPLQKIDLLVQVLVLEYRD